MSLGNKIFSLEHKIALVTGATGHLGLEITRALGNSGAHVFVNSRSAEKAEDCILKLTNEGLSVEAAVFDVTSEAEVKSFFSSFEGKLNIIVNNAYSGCEGVIETASVNDYEESYRHSVIASHIMVANALAALKKAAKEDGEASVINISSMYGMVSPDLSIYETAQSSNPPSYGAAKAGLIQFSKYAAIEFAKYNIRVNSISPGPFPSINVQKDRPELIKALEDKVPLARIGQPEEMGGAIVFLASSASSFVTGSNLVVDGGWTAT